MHYLSYVGETVTSIPEKICDFFNEPVKTTRKEQLTTITLCVLIGTLIGLFAASRRPVVVNVTDKRKNTNVNEY